MKKSNVTGGSGLPKNVAALLSYVLGFVSGFVFLLIEKDKFVRFHAFQSIFTSLAAFLIQTGLSMFRLYSLSELVSYVTFGVFIVLMIKAYRGEKYMLPVIGEMAEKYA